MLRVVNIETDQRLEGFCSRYFFCINRAANISACIDDEGNLFVYSIDEENAILKCNLMLHVQHPISNIPAMYRVIWCPYVPTLDE